MHREVNRVQLAPLAASLLPSSTGKAKGPEANEKNPRASDPFSVRAIQDSNLWPLALEGRLSRPPHPVENLEASRSCPGGQSPDCSHGQIRTLAPRRLLL